MCVVLRRKYRTFRVLWKMVYRNYWSHSRRALWAAKNVRHGRSRKRSLLLDWMIFPAWMIYSRAKRHIGKGPAPIMRRRVVARHASRRTVMLRVRRPKKILRGVSIMASAACLFTGVLTAMVGISRRIPGMNNASFIALVLYRLKSDARHRAHRFFYWSFVLGGTSTS